MCVTNRKNLKKELDKEEKGGIIEVRPERMCRE